MTFIIRWSLAHRYLVLVVFGVLSALGLWVARSSPIDVFPDLDRPGVTVMTHIPGLSPEETEARLTEPIEQVLRDLPGVDALWSSSSIGLSHVHVVFGWDEDQEKVRHAVQERLTTVQSRLPAGAAPVLLPFVSVMGEIELIGVSGAAPPVLRRFADDVLRPALTGIRGVAQVLVIGGDVQELAVLVDPTALAARGMTMADVRGAVAKAGQTGIGGILPYDNQEYLVRVLAPARGADLGGLVVGRGPHGLVRVGDVAKVEPRAILKRGSAGINGSPGVILSVYKGPGEDTRRLSREITAAIADLGARVPPGVVLDRVFQQTDFIQTAIDGVTSALREGGLLVVLVVVAFLASWRASAITLTALPISFLLAVLCLRDLGLTLNTMTLGGLAIAAGQLVDDAVVDVENVWRRLRQRAVVFESASVIAEASLEVRGSILYATLVVVLSAVPVALLSGIEGRLMRPLVVAYVVALGISLVVALTLTPALCALLLGGKARRDSGPGEAPLVRALKPVAERLVRWALRYPRVPLVGAAILIAVALAALPRLPRELLPPFNEGTLTINLAAVPGITLDDSDRLGSLAEQLILEVPEVLRTARRTGRAELDTHSAGVHQSEIEVALRPAERGDRPRAAIEADLRARLRSLPGLVLYLGQPISHRLEHLLEGVNGDIVVRIHGPPTGAATSSDALTLRALGEQVRKAMAGIPGIVDLQAEKQLDIPELLVEVDRARAGAAGVNPGDVAQQAQDSIYGAVAGRAALDGKTVDVRVRVADWAQSSPTAIAALPVAVAGSTVPLSQVATVREAPGLDYLNRDGGRRLFLVMANVQGRDPAAAARDAEDAVARSVQLPTGYTVTFGGQWAETEAAQGRLLWYGLLALLAVAAALLFHFRSGALTAVTLLNVPLSLVGSVAVLWACHEPLSVAAALGFVAVCGIASRNTILLLGHYRHLEDEEDQTFGEELIVEGSLDRLTPMLMTALTAGLALVPWVLSRQAPGKEILGPVALVIVGGLCSSTLLDLLVTPVAYRLWGKRGSRPAGGS